MAKGTTQGSLEKALEDNDGEVEYGFIMQPHTLRLFSPQTIQCIKDKFIKRKGLGRVERTDADGNSLWNKTEEMWLNLYKNKKVVPGLSVMHRVSWKDEWLAEAYMETDYSTLVADDFQKTINDYLSYLVKEGHVYEA